jgi:hypothetical protein
LLRLCPLPLRFRFFFTRIKKSSTRKKGRKGTTPRVLASANEAESMASARVPAGARKRRGLALAAWLPSSAMSLAHPWAESQTEGGQRRGPRVLGYGATAGYRPVPLCALAAAACRCRYHATRHRQPGWLVTCRSYLYPPASVGRCSHSKATLSLSLSLNHLPPLSPHHSSSPPPSPWAA